MPSSGAVDLDALAACCDALGSPRRVAMLVALREPQSAQDLAKALKLTRPAAIRHLRKLQSLGFVQRLPGRAVRGPLASYVAVPERLAQLAAHIGVFRDHVEGGRGRA